MRSTAAFEKGRLSNPRTSFDIFPYLLFPPASVNSLILAQNVSVQVIPATSALCSMFHSFTIESISLHRLCLNFAAIFVISALICDDAE